MTAYENMKTKLEATGLYSITEGSLIHAEIMAYAAGLDYFYNALGELLRECFAATAEDYGLTIRESMIRKYNLDTTIAGRRKSIIAAMSMKGGIFDDSALRKILSLFNLTAHFGLNQEGDTMICSCSNALSTAEYNLLTRQISQLMPSWLDFELSIS